MLDTLLSFLLLYKYAALAIVVFTAAIAIPWPVYTLLLATGAFASQSYFSFPISLAVTISANVLGDLTGFFIARMYGPITLRFFRIRVTPAFARVEHYMRSNTGITIFLTRFVGIVEIGANLLAGYSRVSVAKFLMADVVGNTVSDGGVLTVGYIVGANWQNFTNMVSETEWIILAIIVTVIIAGMRVHRGRRR